MIKTLLILLLLISISLPVAHAKINREAMLKAADTKSSGEYVRTRFLKVLKRPFDKTDTRKKLLLVGDSHAQDFYNALLEAKKLQNYQISTRYIPFRCQITLSRDANEHRAAKDIEFCKGVDDLQKAKAQLAEADVIILVANWKKWAAEDLPNTIEQLDIAEHQSLFVVGRKSFGKINVRKYLRMSEDGLKALRNKTEEQHIAINDLMKSTLDENVFVNLHEIICGKVGGCPIVTEDLYLLSFDGGHLTKQGALFVGNKLFSKSVLKSLE